MRLILLAVLAVLTSTPAAEAGLFRCRGKAKVVVRWRGCATCNAAPSVFLPCQTVPTAVPSPQAAPQAPAKVYPAPGPVGYGGEAGAFLMALNAFRASRGVRPAMWDVTLAAFAASNRGTHDGTSNPGGWQAWSPLSSLTASLPLWIASPPHASILLSGVVVGASPSATGSTLNAR